MWNFLSNRKHLNVSWRVMELPVETYWGRSNAEVGTPRLSMSRSFLVRPFKFFSFFWFVLIVMFCDWKSSHANDVRGLHSSPLKFKSLVVDLPQHFLFYRNGESVRKQNKSMKVLRFIQTTYRTKITFFFLSFLLP